MLGPKCPSQQMSINAAIVFDFFLTGAINFGGEFCTDSSSKRKLRRALVTTNKLSIIFRDPPRCVNQTVRFTASIPNIAISHSTFRKTALGLYGPARGGQNQDKEVRKDLKPVEMSEYFHLCISKSVILTTHGSLLHTSHRV